MTRVVKAKDWATSIPIVAECIISNYLTNTSYMYDAADLTCIYSSYLVSVSLLFYNL